MVTLEDPCTVAKDLVDEDWSTDTGGAKPELLLRRENDAKGMTPAKGQVWFFEQNNETNKVDLFGNFEDVPCTFAVEIRGNTYDRCAEIWQEVERIRRLRGSDPGSTLTSPDTTFQRWKKRDSPPGWEQLGNFRRLINYEMVEYDLQIRS